MPGSRARRGKGTKGPEIWIPDYDGTDCGFRARVREGASGKPRYCARSMARSA